MEVAREILVLPFHGQGHLFPCIELCKHLSSRNFHVTIILSSSLSSSIPSSLSLRHPLIRISEISASAAPPPPPPEDSSPPQPGGPFRRQNDQMGQEVEALLSGRPDDSPRPVCAVIDVMMSWSKELFSKFEIPTVAFFTSGACSAAMEYSMWKAPLHELKKPGDTMPLPGLPDDMDISYSEIQRKEGGGRGGGGRGFGRPGFGPGGLGFGRPGFGPNGSGFVRPDFLPDGAGFAHQGLVRPGFVPDGAGFGPDGPGFARPGFGPGGPGVGYPGGRPGFADGMGPGGVRPFGRGFGGPPTPGGEPKWMGEAEGTIGIIMNTCHELEGSFLDYVGRQLGKPVWGVGPLLPEEYWKSAGSVLRDRDVRSKKQSSHTEEEVIQWLDSKPRGSVLYVSFGSEVGPSNDEYVELARALEESDRAFIWVVRPSSRGPGRGPEPAGSGEEGYYPHELEAKAGSRGLIIRGWAPQLLILSHPSTGGFLTHCGWNSTVEAIGRGVPMLAWPIRGDQFYNAKLVVSHLKVGHMVLETDYSKMVKKDDVAEGIDKLMSDQGAKTRAAAMKEKFKGGFPASSEAALDALRDFVVGSKVE